MSFCTGTTLGGATLVQLESHKNILVETGAPCQVLEEVFQDAIINLL